MRELSLHILDIAQNGIAAGASEMELSLRYRAGDGLLTAVIADNGCGMSAEMAARATDPFVTSRTTRPVGLGLPFWKMAAEATGGSFQLRSREGSGTAVTASFYTRHIDCLPLGDMPATVAALFGGCGENLEMIYRAEGPGGAFALDTRELREALGGVPLSDPEVQQFIESAVREGHAEAGMPD